MLKFKTLSRLAASLALVLVTAPALADSTHKDVKECPSNLIPASADASGTLRTMDEEFGAGAQAITLCLQNRRHAKVVISVDATHPTNKAGVTQTQSATFLSNIDLLIQNYEILHEMKIGEDIDIAAVFSTSGALLMTTQHPAWKRQAKDAAGNLMVDVNNLPVYDYTNPFRALVERGMAAGIKFYVCQMASRSQGINMSNKIPGVQFVPGGQIAVADFELSGYAVIKP